MAAEARLIRGGGQRFSDPRRPQRLSSLRARAASGIVCTQASEASSANVCPRGGGGRLPCCLGEARLPQTPTGAARGPPRANAVSGPQRFRRFVISPCSRSVGDRAQASEVSSVNFCGIAAAAALATRSPEEVPPPPDAHGRCAQPAPREPRPRSVFSPRPRRLRCFAISPCSRGVGDRPRRGVRGKFCNFVRRRRRRGIVLRLSSGSRRIAAPVPREYSEAGSRLRRGSHWDIPRRDRDGAAHRRLLRDARRLISAAARIAPRAARRSHSGQFANASRPSL